ncbi:MAG: phenylacetate--CoA ligase family protein [Candidatus Helarchaeota archaeon]
MIDKLVINFLYPLNQRLSGRRTLELLKYFEFLNTQTREKIEKNQWKCLKNILYHAYNNVPFYKESFDSIGIKPSDINRIEDFKYLPILEKKDIKKNPSKFIAQQYSSKLSEVRTAGSTGTPLKYFMSKDAFSANQAAAWRSRKWWGLNIGDPNVLFWGHSASFHPGIKGKLACITRPFKDRLLNRRTFSAYEMYDQNMVRIWKIIMKFKPCYIRGYASSLYSFAKFLKEKKIQTHMVPLKAIISTSEVLYEWQRRLIYEVFKCPVINEYGATEVGIIGYECPQGKLHLMEEIIFVELVESLGAKKEKYKDILVTQLYNYGAPLIRYRIGDIAQNIKKECTCNSNLLILEGLKGRSHDLIKTPKGQSIHGELFTHILEQFDNIKKFQVVQYKSYGIKIRIVLSNKKEKVDEKYIEKHILNRIGENLEIIFEYVDDIKQDESGKYRWVISEL